MGRQNTSVAAIFVGVSLASLTILPREAAESGAPKGPKHPADGLADESVLSDWSPEKAAEFLANSGFPSPQFRGDNRILPHPTWRWP